MKVTKVIFPDKQNNITDFGAKQDSTFDNTLAINTAIKKAHENGGGRVVIPAGYWHTSGIVLKSNVNLHISEDAILHFSDKREDYLPQKFVRWEGIECMNYAPLIYAKDCENIGISGKGKIDGKGKN